jgi:Fe-S cluster assembly protein SufD
MEYYKSFVEEARELAAKLPEEQNELYKRYVVRLPISDFQAAADGAEEGPNEEKRLLAYAERIHRSFGVKFDVIFGSTRAISTGNSFVKVLDVGGLTEDFFSRKMHQNSEDKIVSFIHAHSSKIILIDVPAGRKAGINLLFANGKLPLSTQVTVKTGRNSELSLFEWCGTLESEGQPLPSFSGIMHELEIGQYSDVEVDVIRNEDFRSYVSGFSKGRVDEGARLSVNYVYNGGRGSRVKNEFSADGYAAQVAVTELVIGCAEQQFDIGTVVINSSRDTVADLESKAALMGGSMCLLKGFAKIQETAPGAKSFVNERGIVLDKGAHMDSIPGMSINNRNVKASHSSATAPVDEDSMFYLMSRGTSEHDAKKLLIAGFFAGSISKISAPFVKEIVSSLVQEKVDRKGFGTIPEASITNMWNVSDMGPAAMGRDNSKMK